MLVRGVDGCRVYSIGANGVDEQGIIRYDDDSVTDEEDDEAFTLLNPDQRNQPATTGVEGEPPPSLRESVKKIGESIGQLNHSPGRQAPDNQD